MSYPRAVMPPDRRLFHRVYRLAVENSVTGTNYPSIPRSASAHPAAAQAQPPRSNGSKSLKQMKESDIVSASDVDVSFEDDAADDTDVCSTL